MILAQASAPGPGTNEIWIVIGAIALVMSILGNLAQINVARRKRERVTLDQPLDVRLIKEFVKAEECLARHAESTSKISAVQLEVHDLRKERTEDARAAAMSRKGMYDQINQVRRDLTEKIDNLPDRIVAQLLNSKRLWKGDQ